MQCHKCKYDERNGGTIEERQEHCLTCDFQDCAETRIKVADGDGGRKVITVQLDAPNIHADFLDLHAIDLNKDNDILQELEIEETQVKMILEFCESVCNLPLRTRLVALSLLANGGLSNTAIMHDTGLSRETIINKRKMLEADPYWSKVLRRAAIYNTPQRRKVKGRRGHPKGTRQKPTHKWTAADIADE